MMGWSPRCYIPSFGKSACRFRRRFLEGFTTYGHDGHLGHVTSIMSSDFHFLVPESFHKKFGSDRQKRFLRKSGLNFCIYVYDLGPRSRNDLDHQYLHTFMKSISCLYLLTFRSLAAIVSEKSTVFTFSHRKT